MTPSKANLVGAEEKFVKVRQTHPCWCIPAGIVGQLNYFGVTSVTQEDIVMEYCNEYGDMALVIPKQGPAELIKISELNKDQVLQVARQVGFYRGNFDTFAAATQRCISLSNYGLEMWHPKEEAHFHSNLKEAISKGQGVLMSCSIPPDYHIYSVSGYEEDRITAYEPHEGKFSTKTAQEFGANYDCLIIRKTLLK